MKVLQLFADVFTVSNTMCEFTYDLYTSFVISVQNFVF